MIEHDSWSFFNNNLIDFIIRLFSWINKEGIECNEKYIIIVDNICIYNFYYIIHPFKIFFHYLNDTEHINKSINNHN